MAQTIPDHVDILVVGGGPVGACVALLAAQAGYSVGLIEERTPLFASAEALPPLDPRTLALSYASHQSLAAAGLWRPEFFSMTPIDRVHVSQQGGFGRTCLHADDVALPHLGFTVPYSGLVSCIDHVLQHSDVHWLTAARVTRLRSLARYTEVTWADHRGQSSTLTARLVVCADGGGLIEQLPDIRRYEHDYQQSAIIAPLGTSVPHHNQAFERFSDDGPMALLPAEKGMILVWTRDTATAQALLACDEANFIAEFSRVFGDRLGGLSLLGERVALPLRSKIANKVVSSRVVLVGNAAQTMHPVAAQGLNLGLRDARTLVDTLQTGGDPGDSARLAAYARARRQDSLAITGFTHSLIALVDGAGWWRKAARGVGLTTLDTVAPLRRRFAQHLVFGVGAS